MLALGMDLGSRRVKMAALTTAGLAWQRAWDTLSFYKSYGSLSQDGLHLDFTALDLPLDQPASSYPLVVTGYGRNTLNLVGAQVISELKAHLWGIRWQLGLSDFTLLDLGGQDTKVIQARQGRLDDFQMNDKCAAASGRYLENMAAVLELSLEELSRHWQNPVALNATCGIFGESELISRILEGHAVSALAAGINASLVARLHPLLSGFPLDPLIISGGVAHNQAFCKLLSRELGLTPVIPERPQLNGAIGCAYLALQTQEEHSHAHKS